MGIVRVLLHVCLVLLAVPVPTPAPRAAMQLPVPRVSEGSIYPVTSVNAPISKAPTQGKQINMWRAALAPLEDDDEAGHSAAIGAAPKTVWIDAAGSDSAGTGSQSHPWASLHHATQHVRGGDTVMIKGGLYNQNTTLHYGPPGSPGSPTIFKAADRERPVFTGPNDIAPTVRIDDYVRIDGLWFVGKYTHCQQDDKPIANCSAKTQAHIFPGSGGSDPYHGRGKEIVNCTLGGVNGIEQGSTSYMLYRNNRVVLSGDGRFDHGIYLSGGNTMGQMAQHSVVDHNIFLGGQGYAVQGWHRWRNSIITNNIFAGHYWGLVLDGCDHIAANNLYWNQTGEARKEPGFSMWLPGVRIKATGNIFYGGSTRCNSSFEGQGYGDTCSYSGVLMCGNDTELDSNAFLGKLEIHMHLGFA